MTYLAHWIVVLAHHNAVGGGDVSVVGQKRGSVTAEALGLGSACVLE